MCCRKTSTFCPITANIFCKYHDNVEQTYCACFHFSNIEHITRSIDILTDILPALKRCEIIEEYPNDYPYKSFLVIGKTSSEKYIHIVCAIGEDVVWIITEYFPNNIEWEKDFKTRKKGL